MPALLNFGEVQSPNKTFILGDMLELGAESEKFHAELVRSWLNLQSAL